MGINENVGEGDFTVKMDDQWYAYWFAMGLFGLFIIENLVEARQRRHEMVAKRKHRMWMRPFLKRRLSRQRNTMFKLMDEMINVSTLL